MKKNIVITLTLIAIASCGGNDMLEPRMPDELRPTPPVFDTADVGAVTSTEIENGEVWGRVSPNISSKENLLEYRDKKIKEIDQILDLTKDTDNNYLPVVVTMKRPVPINDLLEMIRSYNPTLDKKLKTIRIREIGYMPKADMVPDTDAIAINLVKFESTTGVGQLSAETLSKEEELSKLEAQIAAREKANGGVADYRLIKGVTSVMGTIHRDSVKEMENEPDVFLADIGPVELYSGEMNRASWSDVYQEVKKYANDTTDK